MDEASLADELYQDSSYYINTTSTTTPTTTPTTTQTPIKMNPKLGG